MTGGTKKEWIFRGIVAHMGSDQRCDEGETYTFSSDHSVLITVCEEGHLVKTPLNWSLVELELLDIELTIGERKYILLFKDDGNTQLMRLRQRSDSKTEPTVDKEFRYEVD